MNLIISASDDGYIHHFAAMLHSASLYHPEAHYVLLDGGISAANLAKLISFCEEKGIRLSVLPVERLLRDRLNTGNSTYARLFVPELLGREVERCLYIDADTTIVGPLTPLFELDLGGSPIAAIRDTGDLNITRRESVAHGIAFGDDYFNAGVMVMDLTRWRQESIADRVIDYANAHPERLIVNDQSCLNAVLYMQNHPIDPIWNFFKLRDARKLSGPPRIIHYTTLPKPTEWPESPFADLYKFHRDQTPWPFAKLPPAPRNRFKEARTAVGAAIGIEKYRQRLEYRRLLDFIRTEIGDAALARARALSQARPSADEKTRGPMQDIQHRRTAG